MHSTCKGDILSYQSFPSNPSYIVFVVVVLNWCTWPCSMSVLVCSFGCGILLYKASPLWLCKTVIDVSVYIYETENDAIMFFMEIYIRLVHGDEYIIII